MSDQATDGSNHSGDPSSNQSTDDEAAPGYSTNIDELSDNIGSQFSDARHQYAQRDQADRSNRGYVYERPDYTERYKRPQRNAHQRQQQFSQDLQALEHRRRVEAQRRLEAQRRSRNALRQQRRRYAERLAARRDADRVQYPPKDPKGDDENNQNRRRKPR